jgi:MFS family permease
MESTIRCETNKRWLLLPASPPWRRLFLARILSSFGDQFTRLALLAKIYQMGGSVTGLAAVFIVQALPSVIFSPLAGAVADSGHRRTILVSSDWARSLLLLAIMAANTELQVLLLAGLIATFTAMFGPVEAALEAELLAHDDIVSANSLRTGAQNLVSIAGPAAVAVVIAKLSINAAFLIDAGTFAASGALLFGISQPSVAVAGGSQPQRKTGLALGLKWLIRQPQIRLVFGVNAVLVLLFAMQGPLLFAFVGERTSEPAAKYGILMACLGAGSLIGSFLLYVYKPTQRDRLLVLSSVLVIDAAALYAFTVSAVVWWWCVFMVLMGLISSVYQILVRSYLQTTPTAEYRARVLGLFSALQGPITVLSLTMVGPLSHAADVANILRGCAFAEAAAAATGFFGVRFQAVHSHSGPQPESPESAEEASDGSH